MKPHLKYQPNRLGLIALVRWTVIAAFLSVTGLSYVYLKHQLDASGGQRKALEQNLNELIVQNNVLETQIGLLTSRTSLQRRLDEGFIKLIPITAQAIVHVRPSDAGRMQAARGDADNQFQTVARVGFVRP